MTRSHGRIKQLFPRNPQDSPRVAGGELESEQLMKKEHFLILTSTFCLLLSGCESPQVVRQREMAEARALVAAQYGGNLTPAQEAYLVSQIYGGMEAQRNENNRVAAAIVANGFNEAGQRIAESSRPAPVVNVYQPVQYPAPMPIYQPQPMQNYQIDTPQYQLLHGASPGNIHY